MNPSYKVRINHDLYYPSWTKHPIHGDVLNLTPVKCGYCVKKDCTIPTEKAVADYATMCAEFKTEGI